MKKSSAVPATFCAIIAALILEGCATRTSVRRCIDPNTGRILPDATCTMPVVPAGPLIRYGWVQRGTERICMDLDRNLQVAPQNCMSTPRRSSSSMATRALIGMWVYDGIRRGDRMTGYSTYPRNGADVRSSSGTLIQRGGFGSSGRSSGGWFS